MLVIECAARSDKLPPIKLRPTHAFVWRRHVIKPLLWKEVQPRGIGVKPSLDGQSSYIKFALCFLHKLEKAFGQVGRVIK